MVIKGGGGSVVRSGSSHETDSTDGLHLGATQVTFRAPTEFCMLLHNLMISQFPWSVSCKGKSPQKATAIVVICLLLH